VACRSFGVETNEGQLVLDERLGDLNGQTGQQLLDLTVLQQRNAANVHEAAVSQSRPAAVVPKRLTAAAVPLPV